MRSKGLEAITAAVAVVCGLMAGCSSSKSDEPPAQPAFEEDINAWRTPLDAYVLEPGQIDYARGLVYGDCLRKRGFSPMAAPLPGSNLTPVFNVNGRKIFNTDLAKEFGYHNGPTNGRVVHEAAATEPGEASARIECAQHASKELGSAGKPSNLVYSYKTASYQDAVHSEEFVDAGKRWRTCMLPLGIEDLPAKFEDGVMPTESQRERFGMRAGDAVDAPVGSPLPTTTGEVEEAVFDAKCRDSSGLTSTLYRLEVANQLKLIDGNKEELGRIYRSARDGGGKLDQIIKKYAG